MDLHRKKCIPCEEGGAALSSQDIAELLKNVKAWKIVEHRPTNLSNQFISHLLEKEYLFIDFKAAIVFINEVADVAEFEGHHPDINLHNWNKVTITLYTHKVLGLTENDFIMAAKIDQIIADNI